MKLNKRIIIGILIVVLIPLIAYTTEYTYKNIGLKSGAIIKISHNNQVAAYFGSDVLKQLPDGSGKSNEGPSLNSVLIAAGISKFSNVDISGADDDSPYQLSAKELGDNYRFYYSDHNTVNLVKTSGNSQNFLVENVSEIDAHD